MLLAHFGINLQSDRDGSFFFAYNNHFVADLNENKNAFIMALIFLCCSMEISASALSLSLSFSYSLCRSVIYQTYVFIIF